MNATMPSLNATPRAPGGKSLVRRLRASGSVPAVAYGKGLPSLAITVAPKDVISVLKSEHGRNSVLKLVVAGDGAATPTEILAMICDFSYHPVTRSLEHVDFLQVKLDQPVDVAIPLVMTGKAAGVTLGGVLRQVFRTLPVRCLPDRIPAKIEVDVTPLKLNEHISTKDLKLAEGLEVRLPPEQTLVAVVAPEQERPEEAAPGAAGAVAAPAGAAAAKTAAPAAKTAAAGKDAKAAPAKDAKKK